MSQIASRSLHRVYRSGRNDSMIKVIDRRGFLTPQKRAGLESPAYRYSKSITPIPHSRYVAPTISPCVLFGEPPSWFAESTSLAPHLRSYMKYQQ